MPWCLRLILLITIISQTNCQEDGYFNENSPVLTLNDQNFDNLTGLGLNSNATKIWFIMFYASWCPHCKRLIPVWEELANLTKGKVEVASLECEENQNIRDRLSIQGFPTLMFFAPNNLMYKYSSFRNIENITLFLDEQKWLEQEGIEIPKEVSQWKRFTRKLFSPFIVVGVLVFTIILLVFCVIADEKRNKKQHNLNMYNKNTNEKKYS